MNQIKTILGVLFLMAIVSFGCKKKTTTPPPDPNKCEDFTDARDGRKYKVVKIGEQCWMAENLDNDTGDSTSCYDNDSKNCDIYGKMYEYSAAVDACPDGWHIPEREEWEQLIDELGGGIDVGSKLKEGGSSGFNAKLGGVFFDYGNKYLYLNDQTYFWTSTNSGSAALKVTFVIFKNNTGYAYGRLGNIDRTYCRCVKDK
jgi:uncharacterized protein (TIGR02145 family)